MRAGDPGGSLHHRRRYEEILLRPRYPVGPGKSSDHIKSNPTRQDPKGPSICVNTPYTARRTLRGVKPLLNDHAAQRMPDENRGDAEILYDLIWIADIIRQPCGRVDSRCSLPPCPRRLNAIEQEVLVPDPGATVGAVDEKQGHAPVRVGMGGRAIDDFQLHSTANCPLITRPL